MIDGASVQRDSNEPYPSPDEPSMSIKIINSSFNVRSMKHIKQNQFFMSLIKRLSWQMVHIAHTLDCIAFCLVSLFCLCLIFMILPRGNDSLVSVLIIFIMYAIYTYAEVCAVGALFVFLYLMFIYSYKLMPADVSFIWRVYHSRVL